VIVVASLLQPLEDLLSWALIHLHDIIGSWSWAIVALTIIVRMLLVPLTVRQIHSMQNLQAHVPEMKAIQARWKHDRQRMNQEMMAFYKENQINPAASCLPTLAQLPVFFSLFFVLKDFEKDLIASHGAGGLDWLGLVTITQDTKVGWGPLLIVLYAISQLTSSYLMSQNMQPAQRAMLLILPIAFIPFVLNFPSGLMLYWLTTNLWTTGQGLVTRRLVPKREPPPKRSSRTPPKSELQAAEAPKAAADRKTAAPPQRVRKVKRKKGSRR
jgi:YidC/Oxa1 family membrane protein insertase